MDPDPPLRDIRCFTTVAEQLSFSRAATTLGMSQPAVSQALARLERSLGVRLFERTSRDVRLTEAGTALLPLAESLLTGATRLTAEAARLAASANGPMRLAYCPLVGGLVARLLRRLRTRAPGTDLDLLPASWSEATDGLARGSVSAAVMSSPFPVGLAVTARFTVGVTHLAVPRSHPLATATAVSWTALAGHDVVLPATRPPGSVWARLAQGLPDDATVVAAPARDDLQAGLDLVAAGVGSMPVPRILVETVRRTDVAFPALRDPGLFLSYGLAWTPDNATGTLLTLVDTIREVFRAGGRRESSTGTPAFRGRVPPGAG